MSVKSTNARREASGTKHNLKKENDMAKRIKLTELLALLSTTISGLDSDNIPKKGFIGEMEYRGETIQVHNSPNGNFFTELDGKTRVIVKLNKIFPKDSTVSFSKHPFHVIAHSDYFDIIVNANVLTETITKIVGHAPRQGRFRLDYITTIKTLTALEAKLGAVNDYWNNKDNALPT